MCRQLQAALGDGSILDVEPADDKTMRVFGRAPPPPAAADPIDALAQQAAARQIFLARRLFTLATDIVDEAGADIVPVHRALGVGAVLQVMAALKAPPSRNVLMALPIDEWKALREAWVRAMEDRPRP